LLSSIPYIGTIGGLLALVGAILVILGRQAFGKLHTNYAIWSIAIYLVGLVVLVISLTMFTLSLTPGSLGASGQALPDYLSSAFNNLLIGAIVGGAITGLAIVLFTYALQESVGRTLLWAGYIASMIVNVLVYLLITPDIAPAVQQAISGGVFNPAPLNDLLVTIRTLQLLALVPALMFSGAFYMAWSRIRRGEIPSQKTETPPVSSGF